MYKGSSQNKQSSLDRGKLSDWSNGIEILSIADKIELVKNGLSILQTRIDLAIGTPERKKLGIQKCEMQKELAALNIEKGKISKAKNLSNQGITQAFMEAARAILTKSQFELVFATARRDLETAKKLAGDAQS